MDISFIKNILLISLAGIEHAKINVTGYDKQLTTKTNECIMNFLGEHTSRFFKFGETSHIKNFEKLKLIITQTLKNVGKALQANVSNKENTTRENQRNENENVGLLSSVS